MVVSLKKDNKDIFLIKAEQNYEPYWYYVRVEKLKQPLVKKRSEFSLEEIEGLGEIIFWGIGEEPPLYYKEKIEKSDFS
ncbi:MAG: hypothetical protein SFT90_04180 [Rickettsiales bacterium]|nr:hypothetical protein [Rickettsiales bacterium]